MAPGLTDRQRGMKPLYVEPSGRLWASRLGQVFCRESGEGFKLAGAWPMGGVGVLARFSRLASRFFRCGFQGLVALPNGAALATVRKRLLKLDPGADRFREVFRFPRGSRPINICRTPSGKIYFGEYFFNQKRDAVDIYCSDDDGESWRIVHEFSPGQVRHVHGIIHDPYRRGCWVLTGDDDKESRILFTDDDFASLRVIFEGTQQVRSVILIPLSDSLLSATDTPFEQNHIQRLDPDTGRIERLMPVSGSVFYACQAGQYKVISVAVEPSKVNTCKFASLLISKDGRQWRELYRRKKDIWQTPYCRCLPDHIAELPFFQHGAFVLPQGRCDSPTLYAYGQAVADDDDCMLCWDLDKAWEDLTVI